ncbi:MAG: BrnT family toxin [Rhodospirillales bacterium]|tara:strand:- start:1622 stop:1909 length:288 start_codon:yes stop_codon:yes gene_type:complete
MGDAFEWDPRKARANLERHNVSFQVAVEIFDGPCIVSRDVRRDYGEDRYQSMGLAGGRCLVVVHTPRGNRTRIISARKANEREQARYFKEIQGEG